MVAGFEIADYFLEPSQTVPGYTSLAVLLLVLAGVIIVCVGVVGLYVGRIFEQVKDRPLYLISDQAEPPARTPTLGLPGSETIAAPTGDRAPSARPASPA